MTPTATEQGSRTQLADEIRKRQRFVITSHIRPDGDAIGSSLAMAYALRLFLVQVAQDLFDAVLVRDRFVESERELGNPAQPEDAADPPAQERRRAPERLLGLAPRFLVAEAGVEDARQLQVRRDLHARQRDEPDPWIVHRATAEQRAQLVADLLADAIGSVTLGHFNSQLPTRTPTGRPTPAGGVGNRSSALTRVTR
jgi:hypothetical protein